LHLEALRALGAQIDLHEGYIYAQAPRGLKGGRVEFPFSSVGATEHAMLAAVLADGVTELIGAAREPEIIDLAQCLGAMGARIEGAGTSHIVITGVGSLSGADYAVAPDRIEAGTYAMAVAMAGGEVRLTRARAEDIAALLDKMEQAGVEVERLNDGLIVRRNGARLRAVDVETSPYPGFPTDLQAQFMALMSLAEGESVVRETVFENRFMHVPELRRMGADITTTGREARVRGVERLEGAPVMATDLRASVGLVIAGLAARGETVVDRVYHLDRGFERLEDKLSACGAKVRRLTNGGGV
ncbi:MAG: UDP-N-acetylglucosamine 1-carboxyvinyltransferase, partial [Alphaproteobacteria bacterium]|nr:UDP-N-acetylglucosamine 1-carboxyvinyltransferase [Alphaproteobacteria bacterium]